MKNGVQKWRKIEKTGLPWISSLNTIMSQIQFPILDGSSLLIVTDYSGYEKLSKYLVFSIIIIDIEKIHEWDILRRQTREIYLKNNRRMSYKNLNDKKRFNALEPFLHSANNINGLCICIAQTKKMNKSFFSIDKFKIYKEMGFIDNFEGKWNARSLNNMWNIVSLISLFIAGFVKPKQNVYWISDEDEIFANPEKSRDTAKIISAMTDMFVDFELGELGVGTTYLDEGDRLEEDLCSIADLSAGAYCEIVNRLRKMAGDRIICGFEYPTPLFSKKTEIIASWLMNDVHRLKRVLLLMEEGRDGMYGLTSLEIN